MFIFFLQTLDLVLLGSLGLFLVFYVLSWITLAVRLVASSLYKPRKSDGTQTTRNLSVVLPVYNEKRLTFGACLTALEHALKNTPGVHEVLVIENGTHEHETLVASFGFTYLRQHTPSKRNAILQGVSVAKNPLTVLLDSDTICDPSVLAHLASNFGDPNVGGVVPHQSIYGAETLMDRMCDWYEEIRFGNTTPGLSASGAVPCLIGRLYMVRTQLLKDYMGKFVNQTILGIRMETGDDRVITSDLLKQGYKTIYDDSARVYTFAPQTLSAFVKQRLRWSRSSFRETVASLGWLWRFPYAFFVMWSDILMRWLFLVVIVSYTIRATTGNLGIHVFDIPLWGYALGGAIGFFISGWLKQIPHLLRRPQDFWHTPAFLLLNTFVLTPVEWYGNLTCLKQGWLTRK